METYQLALEHDGWTLRRLPANLGIRRFADRREALRESLSLVHSRGTSLILAPASRGQRRGKAA